MRQILGEEKGFTLVEVLIVVTMIGILASVAVPRFSSSLELANTAKIQADLQTLDAAVVMYEAENGTSPGNLTDIAAYVNDVPSPPKGKCRLKNSATATNVTATAYVLADVTTGGVTQCRATLDGHVAGDFGK